MSLQNNAAPINYQGKEYQSSKHVSDETLHAHFSSVDDTWKIVEPILQKVGTTRLANITGLDRIGIPVFNAIRPNLDGYAVAHGKGLTVKAAKLSAAVESLERYYAIATDIPVFTMTYRELQKHYTVIPADKLPLTSKSFFHHDWPVKWTLGWDIVHQEEIPVPVGLVSLKIPVPPADLLLFLTSSNGLAAGTDFLEAVAQGLLEVIERDAVTCSVMAARAVTPPPLLDALNKVKLDTIPFPEVVKLIEQIEDAGIMLVLADNTVDTEVPAYNCFLFDTINPSYGLTHGMGASLDPATAMLRAIMEAVQARAVFYSGVRDIFFHSQHMVHKIKNAKTLFQRIMNEEKQGRDASRRDASSLKSKANATFEGDIALCIEKLKNVGIDQVIVFAFTDPDAEFCALKVIVPGLEGYMHPYYRPGQRAKAYLKRIKTL